jgi:hypothetical protein
MDARDVVKWREVIPSESGKESQIVLRIEALDASVYSAYNMLAEEKSADKIRRTTTCPSVNIGMV